MPRVTVAVAAYNAARFLGETLDSVLAQTYRDLELIVTDDGSSDGTAEIAASRAEVTVLRQANAGPAAARNAAIRRGGGELVAILDADDLWLPDKLARQVARMDQRPDCVLAGTLAETFGGPTPAPPPEPLREGEVTGALIAGDFLTASSVVFRREPFERAGGFDTDRGLISVEDYDLWLRLSRLGPFTGVHEVLVRRRWHDANLSADPLQLARRALAVIEKFERGLPAAEASTHAETLARRKGELGYLVGRALLSRGERLDGRRALRRARRASRAWAARALPLEALSLLPRPWLLALHHFRERRRRQA